MKHAVSFFVLAVSCLGGKEGGIVIVGGDASGSGSGTAAAEAHPHTGKVAPFQSGDPGVTLDGKAQDILDSGNPYQTQVVQEGGASGRGMVVQDVHAPVHIVWERILDFDQYAQMVPKTVESKTYKTDKLKHNQKRIWVRMKIGFPLLKLQFFVNHLYDPSQHSLTWTLDYTKKSDLDDSCGYWYVIPHPDKPKEWTRVYYAVEVSVFDWIPGVIVDFMRKKALTDATSWVKRFSELQFAEQKPTQDASNAAIEAAETEALSRPQKDQWVPWIPWGTGGRKPSPEEPSDESSDVATAVKPPDTCTDESSDKSVAGIGNPSPTGIGIKRYFLVSTVLALVFYNIHLYFSQ